MRFIQVLRSLPVLLCVVWLMGTDYQADAKELRVPTDYPDINSAVKAAQPGDQVLVSGDHVCKETVTVDKSINMSSSPAGARFEVDNGNGMIISGNAVDVSIAGFTFRCKGNGINVKAGVSPSTQVRLSNLCFQKNGLHGVASFENIALTVEKCEFIDNACGLMINTLKSKRTNNGKLILKNIKAHGNHNKGVTIAANSQYAIEATDSLFSKNATGLDINAVLAECKITNSQFNGNQTGILAEVRGQIDIANSSFGNNSEYGINLCYTYKRILGPAKLNLSHCTVKNNKTGINKRGISEFELCGSDSIISNNKIDGILILGERYLPKERISLENVDIIDNNRGGLIVIALGKFSLKNCRIQRNKLVGLGTSSPFTQILKGEVLNTDFSTMTLKNDFQAVNSIFNQNGTAGLGIACPGEYVLTRCAVSENEVNGISVCLPKAAKGFNIPPVALKLSDCNIVSNHDNGLAHFGYCNLTSSINNTHFSSNVTGMYFNSQDGCSSNVELTSSALSGGKAAILIDDPLVLSLHDDKDSSREDARPKSYHCLSPKANLTLCDVLIDKRVVPIANYMGEESMSCVMTQGLSAAKNQGNHELNQDLNIPIEKYEALFTYLTLARICLALEYRDVAARFYESAGQLKQQLPANHPSPCDLEKQINLIFADVERELKQEKPSTPRQADKAASQIRAMSLIFALSKSQYVSSDMKAAGEMQVLKDKALQSLLDALMAALSARGDQASINKLTSLLDEYMFSVFSKSQEVDGLPMTKRNEAVFSEQECASAIQWLGKNADPVMKGVTEPDGVYHAKMAAWLRLLHDSKGELEHLMRLTEISPTSLQAIQAWERLTELYLTLWQLPEKAIEMQQQIVKNFGATEHEYKARLQIAKIYYEQKDYQKAIFELAQLLKRLPENYSSEPARTMLGLAYLGIQAYDDARNEFALVINKDQGEYREKCLYLMGYSFICEQKYGESVKPFNDLINLYPEGSYSKQALAFLEKIKGDGKK